MTQSHSPPNVPWYLESIAASPGRSHDVTDERKPRYPAEKDGNGKLEDLCD
jgi:hypothetical protein